MTRRGTLAAALAALLLLGVAAAAAIGATRSEAAPLAEEKDEAPAPAPEPGPAPLAELASTIQRTFVSTSGNDANPCTPAAPCRSFAAALAATTAGGEIVALDSGGYGAFTINKAVTVAGAPGAHVAITVFSGTGIHVNAGTTDTVVLRNLYLTGLGGSQGIFFGAGGTLHVESVVAGGFETFGLNATAPDANVVVRDSTFRHNGDEGVRVFGTLRAEIADSRADRNGGRGFFLRNGARGSIERSAATRNDISGFEFWFGAVFAVSESVADGNAFSGVVVEDNGTSVTVTASVLSNNTGAGLRTAAGAPAARISGSTVTGNGTGLQRASGALETYGDNLVRGNTTETSGTITTVGKT